MSKRTYTFENGKILRNGEPVGSFNEESRQIEQLNEELPPNVRGIIEGMLRSGTREADDPEYSSEQPPPQDPKLGDKTPEYVAWLKRTNPKEAEKRYAGRRVNLEAPASEPGDIPAKEMPEEPKEEWH